MPKFKLTPVPDRLSDPIWHHSQTPHEACYTSADLEDRARNNAANHFRPMSKRTGFETIKYVSPWLDPELTSCKAVAEIAGLEMPDGLVQRESETRRAH